MIIIAICLAIGLGLIIRRACQNAGDGNNIPPRYD